MTKNWNDLPNKLKKMIVDKTDLETRVRQLKQCSKAMKALTESAPIYVNEVKFEDEYIYPDSDDDEHDCPYVTRKHFEVDDFVLRGGAERVEKVNYLFGWYRFDTDDDVEPKTSIEKYFTKFMLPGNVHMNVFKTNTELPEELKNSDIRINTKCCTLGSHVVDAMEYISRLTSDTKVVDLPNAYYKTNVLIGLGLNPAIINADKLMILRKNDINDQQLVNFKCTELILDNSDVNLEGLNKFIKKWLAEDYPIGSKIEYRHCNGRQDVNDLDKLMDGLNYEPFEWTEEKEKKMLMSMDSQKEMFIHYDNFDTLHITIQELYVKTTRNWNGLPNELKFMIIDRMDMFTRTKLKMCSKSDKSIVESVPMIIERIEAFYHSERKELYNDFFHFVEYEKGKIEKIIGSEPYPLKLPKKLRKYTTKHLFEKFLGNLLLHGNLHMDLFYTDLRFPSKLSNTTINTKSAGIGGEDIMKWIQVLSHKTKDIEVYGEKDENVLEGIGLIPVIINAKVLYIKAKNDITDNQLMTFKFTKGTIKYSKITENGVNQLIQKIASSDYPLDTKIKLYTIKESENEEELHRVKFRLPMSSGKELIYSYDTISNYFRIEVRKVGKPL